MSFFVDEKKKKALIFTSCIVGVVLSVKYILPYCWPLILALFIVAPIYDRLWMMQKKTHINRCVLVATFVLFGVTGILLVLFVFAYLLTQVCMMRISAVGEMGVHCVDCFEGWCEQFAEVTGMRMDFLAQNLQISISEGSRDVSRQILPKLLQKGIASFRGVATGVAVLVIVSMLIVLLSREYPQWRCAFYSSEILSPVRNIVIRLKNVGKVYLRAELITMLVIATIAVAGFLLTGADSPFLYGFITGVLDALPFIGTGIILIPTSIWYLFEKRFLAAAIMIATYCLCAITREFLESRLLGDGMKVSPAGVLISIFAGLKYYGVLGFFLGPLTLILLLECYKEIYNIPLEE